jgi:hypothetical protein
MNRIRVVVSIVCIALASCGGKTSDVGGESNWVKACGGGSECARDASAAPTSRAESGDAGGSDLVGEQAGPNHKGPDGDAGGVANPTSRVDPAEPADPGQPMAATSAAAGTADAGPIDSVQPVMLNAGCAYPGAVDWDTVTPERWSASLPFWNGELSPECEIELSPLTSLIPLDEGDSASLPVANPGVWGRAEVVWIEDFNLDGIGDFVLSYPDEPSAEAEGAVTHSLWVSNLEDGELRYGEYHCPSLDALLGVEQVRTVDADGDGVKDLVLGRNYEVYRLWLNTPGGFELGFELSGEGTLRDVQFADMDGEPGLEAVMSFETILDQEAFRGTDWENAWQSSVSLVKWEPGVGWVDGITSQSVDIPDSVPLQTGDFFFVDAAGDGQLQAAALTSDGFAELLSIGSFRDQIESDAPVASMPPTFLEERTAPVLRAWTLHDSIAQIAILSDQELELYGDVGEFLEVGSVPTAFGLERTSVLDVPNRFDAQAPMDVDGDGAIDFVELSAASSDPTVPRQQLAVHFGDLVAHFGPSPQVLDLPRPIDALARAAVSSSAAELGLLVYGAAEIDTADANGSVASSVFPAAFQQVRCRD